MKQFLRAIGGDASFNFSEITDLGNLKEIGGKILDVKENLKKQFKVVNGKYKRVSNKSLNQGQGQDRDM